MMNGILLLLALQASAVEPPFYNREVKDLRDVGALNENSRALAGGIRKIDLTNGGTINGSLCFADGTCQTTAPAASVTVVSSFTYPATSITATNTSWSGCLAAVSTLTMTTVGNKVRITYSGDLENDSASQVQSIIVLQDGAFFDGQSATVGFIRSQDNNPVGASQNGGFVHVTQNAPVAGTHSWCMGMITDGSTARLNCNTRICQFSVEEIATGIGPTGATGPTGAAGATIAINASMIGDGSSSNVAGVNPSSVAILGSGGYVLNQQLDPSSVTKQGFVTLANLSGVVPAASINLSTITTALNLKVDRDTPAQVNLSTVTTALNLKVDRDTPAQVNLSTITTALALKVDRDTPAQVNLSTITTALASKQDLDADLTDLADGSLTGSKVGDGVAAANIAAGILDTDVIASSVAAVIAPATCGDATTSCRTTFGPDGRITSVSSVTIGNAETATALAADPADAASGYVCRGINAAGTCQPAWIETAATNGSTNPITSDAAFDQLALKANLTGATFTGLVAAPDYTATYGLAAATAALTGALSAASATLTGGGAAPYSLTTSSGIHLLAGQFYMENGSTLRWPDGTVTSTSPAGGGGGAAAKVSSFTYVPAWSTSQTSLVACAPSSTVTVTCAGTCTLQVSFSGAAQIGSYNSEASIGFLVDGGYADARWNATAGGTTWNNKSGGFCDSISMSYRVTLASGSHSFCLTAAVYNAGQTLTIMGATKCGYNNFFATVSQFGVQEY